MNRKDYATRNAMLRDRNIQLLNKALKIVAKAEAKNIPTFNLKLKKLGGDVCEK